MSNPNQEFIDQFPEPVRPYIGRIAEGGQLEATDAARKALQSLAGADPDPGDLSILKGLITKNTSLTKTDSQEIYDTARTKHLADTIECHRIRYIEPEGREGETEVVFTGAVAGEPYTATFKNEEFISRRGPVESEFVRVCTERGIGIDAIPYSMGAWRDLVQEWFDSAEIETVTEREDRMVHYAVESYLRYLNHEKATTDPEKFTGMHQAGLLLQEGVLFDAVKGIDTHLKKEDISGTSTREVIDVLAHRGFLADRPGTQNIGGTNIRVVPFDAERLAEDGYYDDSQLIPEDRDE